MTLVVYLLCSRHTKGLSTSDITETPRWKGCIPVEQSRKLRPYPVSEPGPEAPILPPSSPGLTQAPLSLEEQFRRHWAAMLEGRGSANKRPPRTEVRNSWGFTAGLPGRLQTNHCLGFRCKGGRMKGPWKPETCFKATTLQSQGQACPTSHCPLPGPSRPFCHLSLQDPCLIP
jgi:hypothetical protein